MLRAMPDVTFRDFAGALMANDDAKAATVLSTLLGVEGDAAQSGVSHFKAEMQKSPDFMMKAMGMRTVVEGKDEAGLKTLIGECFGYDDAQCAESAKTVLAHYS
jgi:hypothetical protein